MTPHLYYIKLSAAFQSHWYIQTGVTVRKRSIRVIVGDFLSRMTLNIDGWPWITIGHLSYAASSFVHHFIAIGEFKLELQSGNTQCRSKSTIVFSCVTLKFYGWPWKNNKATLLSNIKLCASFCCHMWIQTGVRVRKLLNGVMTSVTLTFDRWPFAWTSLLSLVITPENFMMIRWWEHSQKGVTDRQTPRRTDRDRQTGRRTEKTFIELLGRS